MKHWKKLATTLALFGVAGVANATVVTFTLSNEVSESGGVLTGDIIVTLNDDTGNDSTVDIEIDMTALSGGESMLGLYLNFDPTKDPTGMTLADTGSVSSEQPIDAGINCCKPDGQDEHDVLIEFANAAGGEFTSGEIYEGTLSLAGGLTAADFDFLSNGAQGTENCAVARVTRTTDLPDNGGSGWFDCEGEGVQVVEPGSLALFGFGIGLLGFVGRRRRNG